MLNDFSPTIDLSMFTGIVATKCLVNEIERSQTGMRLGIEFSQEVLADLKIGASVSMDGVCLTVTEVDGMMVYFDLMSVTLEATTLRALSKGGKVNIERSVKTGDEVGGHEVSGHVDGTAEVVASEKYKGDVKMIFKVPQKFLPYLLSKGFVAVNGVSLTIQKVDRERKTFEVGLIPETLRRTTFDTKRVGDKVNIELNRQTQAIVDTTRAFLESLLPAGRQLKGDAQQLLEQSVKSLTDIKHK